MRFRICLLVSQSIICFNQDETAGITTVDIAVGPSESNWFLAKEAVDGARVTSDQLSL